MRTVEIPGHQGQPSSRRPRPSTAGRWSCACGATPTCASTARSARSWTRSTTGAPEPHGRGRRGLPRAGVHELVVPEGVRPLDRPGRRAPDEHYRIRFLSDPDAQWQSRSLQALRAFAPNLVTIEIAKA